MAFVGRENVRKHHYEQVLIVMEHPTIFVVYNWAKIALNFMNRRQLLFCVQAGICLQDMAGFVLNFLVNSHGSLAPFKSRGWFYAFGGIVSGIVTLNSDVFVQK